MRFKLDHDNLKVGLKVLLPVLLFPDLFQDQQLRIVFIILVSLLLIFVMTYGYGQIKAIPPRDSELFFPLKSNRIWGALADFVCTFLFLGAYMADQKEILYLFIILIYPFDRLIEAYLAHKYERYFVTVDKKQIKIQEDAEKTIVLKEILGITEFPEGTFSLSMENEDKPIYIYVDRIKKLHRMKFLGYMRELKYQVDLKNEELIGA